MSNTRKTTGHSQGNTNNSMPEEPIPRPSPRKPISWLTLWIVFWPSFLLSVLLNEIRVRYDIHDDTGLIFAFAVYVPVCSLGILLPIRKMR
jgi:hypothetical protein